LVFIDADKPSYPAYVEHAVNAAPGGIWPDNMLWHDKVADPAPPDKTTTTLRELGKSIREDGADAQPVGDGLLAAVK
jgi:predicted O-methyltransferase YrrM